MHGHRAKLLDDHDIDYLFRKAGDLQLPQMSRSGALHDLMDYAARTKDDELWMRVAPTVAALAQVNDLSTQVSDHFVRSSPDTAFKTACELAPTLRYMMWRSRARQLGYPHKPLK